MRFGAAPTFAFGTYALFTGVEHCNLGTLQATSPRHAYSSRNGLSARQHGCSTLMSLA